MTARFTGVDVHAVTKTGRVQTSAPDRAHHDAPVLLSLAVGVVVLDALLGLAAGCIAHLGASDKGVWIGTLVGVGLVLCQGLIVALGSALARSRTMRPAESDTRTARSAASAGYSDTDVVVSADPAAHGFSVR